MVKGDVVRRTGGPVPVGIVVRVEDAETFDDYIYHVRWTNCDTILWYSREELKNVNKCKDWKKFREKA